MRPKKTHAENQSRWALYNPESRVTNLNLYCSKISESYADKRQGQPNTRFHQQATLQMKSFIWAFHHWKSWELIESAVYFTALKGSWTNMKVQKNWKSPFNKDSFWQPQTISKAISYLSTIFSIGKSKRKFHPVLKVQSPFLLTCRTAIIGTGSNKMVISTAAASIL